MYVYVTHMKDSAGHDINRVIYLRKYMRDNDIRDYCERFSVDMGDVYLDRYPVLEFNWESARDIK